MGQASAVHALAALPSPLQPAHQDQVGNIDSAAITAAITATHITKR
jgi:hypothetical protein